MDPKCVWSGNTNSLIAKQTLQSTLIGSGYANTLAMIAQAWGGSTASRAATVSRAYQGGSKTDWYLPSKDELNQVYLQKSRVGGFGSSPYWSSSESSNDSAMQQSLYYGKQWVYPKKAACYVRPVRAF
jgi:hypothetical protein